MPTPHLFLLLYVIIFFIVLMFFSYKRSHNKQTMVATDPNCPFALLRNKILLPAKTMKIFRWRLSHRSSTTLPLVQPPPMTLLE